jgi:TonB family protein
VSNSKIYDLINVISQEDFKMRQKIFFTLFCTFIFGFTQIAAQTQPNKEMPKHIEKGVINGSAVMLIKPEYPAAAKAVNASGTVSVQVTVDEEGNVISAAAIGGHPLLQSAAVKAAQQSKFKPTLLSGQPVRVTGIITYNFAVGSNVLSLRQIGYTLALTETSLRWKNYSPNEIIRNLPAEWIEEKEILKNLDTHIRNKEAENEKTENEKPKPNPPAPPLSVRAGSAKDGEKFKIGVVRGTSGSTEPARISETIIFYQPLDAESIERIRELQSKIENRLLTEEKNLWSFRFGKILGKTKAEIADADKTRVNLAELSQTMQTAPQQFGESLWAEIRGISESYGQSAPDAEVRARLEKFIENLSR